MTTTVFNPATASIESIKGRTMKALATITDMHGTTHFRSMRVSEDISIADADIAMKRYADMLKDEIPNVDQIQIQLGGQLYFY